MTPTLKDFLQQISGHPSFQELLKAVERPQVHAFRMSEADKPEVSRAKWIHESGRLAQHQLWLAMLTGKSSEQENP